MTYGNLDHLQRQAHQISKDHGWYETGRSVGDFIALIHSELSEALEEWRDGRPLNEIRALPGDKPEGFPIELADAMIRIMDMAENYGINMAGAIDLKMAYNKTRPHRHGGKLA